MKKLLYSVLAMSVSVAVLGQAQTQPKSFAQDQAQPKVIIETSAGDITCTLFPKQAPKGVENFLSLAKGTKQWIDPETGETKDGVPLYDGTIFHRVIPEFMIQGGDPTGTGTGGTGDRFEVEASGDLTFDRPGRLAYANAGPNTNESQFFITEVATPFLNGKYTIFGQCDVASVDLVKKIARMPRDTRDYPKNPVTIKHIKILS